MGHTSKVQGVGRETLSKGELLRGYQTFSVVLTKGRAFHGGSLSGHFHPVTEEFNGGYPVRIGFAVSRKVKSAAMRNRVRRLMREAYRRNKGRLLKLAQERKRYFALVLLYRGNSSAQIKRLGYAEIESDLQQTLDRILTSQ